jgi:hypothetical protein
MLKRGKNMAEWFNAEKDKHLAEIASAFAERHLSLKRPTAHFSYLSARIKMSDGKFHRYLVECEEVTPDHEKDLAEIGKVSDPEKIPATIIVM